jgi:XRE family transcriptional regulator, aerobic/anaerobic benzoate catabolism transcriptional regulator
MSSTILHKTTDLIVQNDQISRNTSELNKNPFLLALGERLRALRARRGLTRKALAGAASVSERHLANLEQGTGNASILVLLQVAQALECTLAELLGDVTTASPEWLLLRGLLDQRDEVTIQKVRIAATELLGAQAPIVRGAQIALIGLRGAGKTTLGRMLAQELGYAFVELSREIENLAGCNASEIQALYGMSAYRRYERRALEETMSLHANAVIATPGGLVSDLATFNLMLSRCTTVWLQAAPEDHMKRVLDQGDMRPMAASSEAMNDLRRILTGRASFYSKAEFKLNTSAQSLEQTFELLKALILEPRKSAG